MRVHLTINYRSRCLQGSNNFLFLTCWSTSGFSLLHLISHVWQIHGWQTSIVKWMKIRWHRWRLYYRHLTLTCLSSITIFSTSFFTSLSNTCQHMQPSWSKCDEGSVFLSTVIETSLSRVSWTETTRIQYWTNTLMVLLTLLIICPFSISTQAKF